jgi:hypothetical protein
MPITLAWKNCDGDLTRFTASQKNTNPIIIEAEARSISSRAEKRDEVFAISPAALLLI